MLSNRTAMLTIYIPKRYTVVDHWASGQVKAVQQTPLGNRILALGHINYLHDHFDLLNCNFNYNARDSIEHHTTHPLDSSEALTCINRYAIQSVI